MDGRKGVETIKGSSFSGRERGSASVMSFLDDDNEEEEDDEECEEDEEEEEEDGEENEEG